MIIQPAPSAALWEWQSQGRGRLTSPEVFFHPDRERGPSRRWREARALAVCRRCPVLEQCREHALRVNEPYGVWGGMTEKDREAIHAAGTARRLLDKDAG